MIILLDVHCYNEKARTAFRIEFLQFMSQRLTAATTRLPELHEYGNVRGFYDTIKIAIIDILNHKPCTGLLTLSSSLSVKDLLIEKLTIPIDEDNKEFMLDVDKSVLENAPGFDKDNWPDMADPSWGTQIHSHYGSRADWDMDETRTPKVRTGGGGL